MKKLIVILLLLLLVFTIPSALAADDLTYLKATLLNQDPDPGTPGHYVELRWKVEKFGSDELTNITFELELSYPFSFDSSDVSIKSIGDWKGSSDDNDFYILYYKVFLDDDALEDVYDLKLNMVSDQYGVSKEFSVRVGEDEEASFAIGQLITSPLKMYGDSNENKVDVTLENIGDSDAQVVTIDFILPESFSPTYGFSGRANLGTIADGTNKVATFYVDIDDSVSEGEFLGFLNISYSAADDREKKFVVLPLSILVSGKPQFSVESVSFSSDVLTPGSVVDMTLDVKNIGTKEAESVSLRVFKESSQPFSFDEKSDFIGRLAPGDSGLAIVTFTVDDDASLKDFLLDLEVRGIYNQEVIVDDGVARISVSENTNSRSGIFDFKVSVVLALLVILVLSFIFYRVGASKHQR